MKEKMQNMKSGIHSLTVSDSKIRVVSNFGKTSFASTYKLEEYSLALACYKRLTGHVHCGICGKELSSPHCYDCLGYV